MPGKSPFAVLTSLLFIVAVAGLPPEAEAGMPFRRGGSRIAGAFRITGNLFPKKGDIPDLVPAGKILTYRGDSFKQLYGTAGERYVQFGMTSLLSMDYTYFVGRLSIEIVTLDDPIQASGLFYYHRGKVLRTPGEMVDVGAEGVLDTGREGRNLYFYRANMFIKIVYSGKNPVPELLPIGKFIDDKLPANDDDKPAGVEYIRIEGVDEDTIAVTPGFTFDNNALPPSVWASAPGAGTQASDLFIVTRTRDGDARTVFEDYLAYLKMYAKYIEEYDIDGQQYVKAVDPGQGRVVLTRYGNAIIIAARPDGYARGELLIGRVMDRIDEIRGEPKDGPGGRRTYIEEGEEYAEFMAEEEEEDGGGDEEDGAGGRPRWLRNPFRRGE